VTEVPTESGGPVEMPDAIVLEALLRAAPDAVIVSDERGRIVVANERVRPIFGYEPRDLIGSPIENLLPQRLGRLHERHRAGYYRSPETRPMGAGLDLVARRVDGGEFPAEISLSHINSEYGLLVMAIVRDVSEHKLAQTQLEQEQRRLETLIDHSPVGIIVVARDSTVTLVNREAERVFGFRSRAGDRLARYESAFIYRRPDGSQCRTADLPMERALQSAEEVHGEHLILESRDGGELHVLVNATPILTAEGTAEGVMCIFQDINSIAEMDRLRDQLTRLEERQRMEMDLHDRVIGSIYATMLQLEGHADDMSATSPEMSGIMAASVDRLRSVIDDIREHILDNGAAPGSAVLHELLSGLAREFQQTTGIHVAVEGDLELTVADPQLSAICNIVNEALMNAGKHAHPNKVIVSIRQVASELTVQVTDDGDGFDTGIPARSHAHGLRNMQERARLLNGALAIDSKPGGTKVILRLPTNVL
jgi:protein-histidine pros-kinase